MRLKISENCGYYFSENREHAIISFASPLTPMLGLTPLRNCTSYCVIVVDDDGASTSQSFGQSGTVKYYAHHIVFLLQMWLCLTVF